MTIQFIQNSLPGSWHRSDGVLSMYFLAPAITGQKTSVEFTVPTAEGTAVSTWEYEIVSHEGGNWINLINPATQLLQKYRIDVLEKNKELRLHAAEGYDLIFTATL